jgi:hypothetical protein
MKDRFLVVIWSANMHLATTVPVVTATISTANCNKNDINKFQFLVDCCCCCCYLCEVIMKNPNKPHGWI